MTTYPHPNDPRHFHVRTVHMAVDGSITEHNIGETRKPAKGRYLHADDVAAVIRNWLYVGQQVDANLRVVGSQGQRDLDTERALRELAEFFRGGDGR